MKDEATLQNGEAVPKWARIQGSWTCVSLESRLESSNEEKEKDSASGQAPLDEGLLLVFLEEGASRDA